MSTIDNNLINEIRDKVDIVDVVSSYIDLSARGKNYFGVCPFHDDNNPSMCVSKEKQIYTCFSCHETGNVFKFIMEYEHISFVEAVKKCADIAGISLDIGPVKEKNDVKYKELYDIYETSQKFYHNNLKTVAAEDARKYLEARGITEEIINEFGVGLALKEHNLLTKILVKKKFNENDLIRSGLVVKNEFGLNDIYYNRIMFPLTDLEGKIIGYSGRIYHGEEDTSKYINTKETDIFKKGEILYNYHRSKEECRKAGSVIVMEGFMDVIACYIAGVKNTVAPMGTAVTKQQANLIKKQGKEVILCFDGDGAGQKATMACSNELLELGVTPKVIFLEDNMDPDEYIKKNGADAFKEKVNNPISIMDFKLMYLKKNRNLENAEDLANYINDVIEELNKINDEILKEITIKKICEESGLEPSFIKAKLSSKEEAVVIPKNEPEYIPDEYIPDYEPVPPIEEEVTPQTFNKKPSFVSNNRPKNETVIDKRGIPRIIKHKYATDKYSIAEQGLLFYMLKSKEVIRIYDSKVKYMPTGEYYHLAIEISNFYRENGFINVADLISSLEDDEDAIKTIGEILSLDFSENYSLEEINDYISAIKESNVNSRLAKLSEKMRNEKDPMKKAEIAQKMQLLKRGDLND